MLLLERLCESLAKMKGFESVEPKSFAWSDELGSRLEVDLLAVDSLSCALRELRFEVRSLRDASLDILQSWSTEICQRITYLLEHVGPLEVDPLSMTILIRSTPPDRNGGAVAFYEMVIQRAGCLTLRRYGRTRGESDRQPLDIRLTQEVLRKLVHDLVQSVPQPPSSPAAVSAS